MVDASLRKAGKKDAIGRGGYEELGGFPNLDGRRWFCALGRRGGLDRFGL